MKKKIFSPFFKVPIFSGGLTPPRWSAISAGVVHRLVRLPSKQDRRVRFPLPAPFLTNPDCLNWAGGIKTYYRCIIKIEISV